MGRPLCSATTTTVSLNMHHVTNRCELVLAERPLSVCTALTDVNSDGLPYLLTTNSEFNRPAVGKAGVHLDLGLSTGASPL